MKKVLVLGAGYGGLKAVVNLQNKIDKNEVEITLINKNSYHYESTWLHEVSAGTVTPEKASFDIKSLLKDHVNFVEDSVLKVDRENKVVLTENSSYEYDYVVIALGFKSDDFNIQGVKEFCLPITNRNNAYLIKNKIDEKLSYLKENEDKNLTINVIGAGFSGIELLGEFTDIIPKYCNENGLSKDRIIIQNIHPGEYILPNFDKKLIEYATRRLENKGIKFYHKHFMTGATESSITVEHDGVKTELQSDITIWTAGVKGNEVISASDIPNKKDRVIVNEFLQLPEDENIFIIGDCAAVKDPKTGNLLPTTAQLAIQNGQSVAKNLVKVMNNKPLKPFKYSYKGTVCSLGEKDAIGTAFGIKLKGRLASYLKKAVDDRSLFMLGGVKILFKKGKF